MSRHRKTGSLERAGLEIGTDHITTIEAYTGNLRLGQKSTGAESRLYRLNPRVRRHAYYHRILRDAYALLRTDLTAFTQDWTWAELCERGNGWKLFHTLSSAVIRARDALIGERRHGIANHMETVRELRRMCCGGRRYERRAHAAN